MAIPDFQTAMLPILLHLKDGKAITMKQLTVAIADVFKLDDSEREALIPSGGSTVIANRVAWARTYLKKAGLLTAPERGSIQITAQGQAVLAESPTFIGKKFLDRYEGHRAFQSREKVAQNEATLELKADVKAEETPEERVEGAYQEMRANIVEELREAISKNSPAFFENLVVDVMLAMGYGGSRRDAGAALGRSGDGGIDGIIKEDKLGLDAIYLQAKRWEGVVGRPEIQKFAGALQGQRANKGVFITTSSFSKEALDYANNLQTKIILLDGEQLANLMIDHNVGVSRIAVYELKRVDSDYFAKEI
jgi:restriction system protein